MELFIYWWQKEEEKVAKLHFVKKEVKKKPHKNKFLSIPSLSASWESKQFTFSSFLVYWQLCMEPYCSVKFYIDRLFQTGYVVKKGTLFYFLNLTIFLCWWELPSGQFNSEAYRLNSQEQRCAYIRSMWSNIIVSAADLSFMPSENRSQHYDS